MSRKHRSRSVVLGASLLMGGIFLSSCGSDDPFVYRAEDHDYRVRHAIVVQDAVVKTTIDFAVGESNLDAHMLARLARYFDFYVGVGQGPIDVIVRRDGSSADVLLARAETIAAVARQQWLRPREIETRTSEEEANGRPSVELNYRRAVARVPECEDWSRSTTANYDSLPPSNFGCALQADLAKMIVNPADLVHQAPSTLADTPSLSRVILLHRAGQPTSSADNPAGPATAVGATE